MRHILKEGGLLRIDGLQLVVGAEELCLCLDPTLERRDTQDLERGGGAKDRSEKRRTARGDDEEVLEGSKVVVRLTHSKASYGVHAENRERGDPAPDHPMSDAADEDGHDGYGGKPHRVGRLDPTPDQEQEEVALVVVGRDEMSQRAGAPAPPYQEGDAHEEQPRPQNDKSSRGCCMKKNSSMNGKPEVPTSSETEMMVLSLNAWAVSITILRHEPRHHALERAETRLEGQRSLLHKGT